MSLRETATGYLYPQKGNFITGTNRTRNNIEQYFSALKGVDVEIDFFIKDDKGHSIDLTDKIINAIITKSNNSDIDPILAKRLSITDYDNGSAKLVIKDFDTINIDPGFYILNIIVRDENDNLFPVNKNLNFSTSYTLEILDNYIQTVPSTTKIDIFQDVDGTFYSNKVKSTGQTLTTTNGISTFSVNLNEFTGNIGIEGTLAIDPSENDWFKIHINDSETVTYNDFTGIDSYIIEGLFLWVRIYYTLQSGTIDKFNYMV